MTTGVLGRTRLRDRVLWLDAARGAGIFLVVLAHCLRGLEAAAILPPDPVVRLLDRLIYSFHMPLFFLLAGLTFAHVADRRGPGEFLRDRALRLLWPMALWTWIFFAFRGISGGLSNAGTGWEDFPLLPLPPQLHFWFLWAMFLIGCVLYLAQGLARRAGTGAGAGFWWGAFAVSVLLSLWMPVPDALAVWLVPALIHAPCLIAGVLYARIAPPAPGWRGTVLALLVFALSMKLAAFFDGRAVDLAVALAASLSLLTAFRGLAADGPVTRSLAMLGQASMAIFLAHTIFSASLRIGLSLAGIDDTLAHMIAGTAVGLLGPLALWLIARRLGLSRALGF